MVEELPTQWAVDVSVKVAQLRGMLQAAHADPANPCGRRRDAVAATVNGLLAAAEAEVTRAPGPLARWRGTSVARAYQSLHAAETCLVDLMTHDQLVARVPSVVRRIQAVLDRSDPQRAAYERIAHRTDTRSASYREAAREAMRVGYEAADQMYVRVRNFRNLLVVTAVLILLLMAGLVAITALAPSVLPLCFTPAGGPVCPSGAGSPTSGDIPVVAGLGLLGGALAAAFSIRHKRGTSTPYDLPRALAMLKPPLGALAAVAGVLLLGGDFVPGFSELDNQQQILAYALLFGYAQQLLSRLIDNQAHSVLNKLPDKDAEAAQPTAGSPAGPAPKPARLVRTTVRRRSPVRKTRSRLPLGNTRR